MANEALTALATSGIALAQSAVLSVMGALMVYYATIYGLKKILSLMSGGSSDVPEIGDDSFMRQESARTRGGGGFESDQWGDVDDGLSPPSNLFPEIDQDFQDTQRQWSPEAIHASEYLNEVYGDDPAFFDDYKY